MPFDDDPDDERPRPDRLLPPDDRLWRHPSELGPRSLPPAPEPGGRGPALTALAGACLVGAVVAVGAMWWARPTRVVEKQEQPVAVRTTLANQVASFTANTVPTERLAAQLAPSVAVLRVERAGAWTVATAVWIDRHGTLAASAASVAGATSLLVQGTDGVSRAVRVAGTDPATGVAALVADRTVGEPVSVAGRSTRSGEAVAVVGARSSDHGAGAERATVAGVIVRSARERATVGDLVLHDAIQLDRAVPFDALGGGLVDADGSLLGLVVGNAAETGLGAATPAEALVEVATDLRDHGVVRRAWLGVRAVDLDPAAATVLAVAGGARITRVSPDSPAADAGLEVDDVVVAVGDLEVDDASDLVVALRAHEPGDQVSVQYRRGATSASCTAVLAG
ncbi:MAG: serine protease [Actinobacteria bacterium]|nr:serine protease [Actinomycetota bacterium]